MSITTQPSFVIGIPSRITLPFTGGGAAPRNHDLAPDGKRFLGVIPAGSTGTSIAINVVVNWFEELKARVPAGQ